jgi:uncharacterized membrane protein (DUF441 family)
VAIIPIIPIAIGRITIQTITEKIMAIKLIIPIAIGRITVQTTAKNPSSDSMSYSFASSVPW